MQARGLIYKAVTQSVLLYGSEIWVVTREMRNFLSGSTTGWRDG